MVSSMLFIGLGGSGGKTLRAIKQELIRKLDSVGYEGGIPAAWQFLQIDTTYDGVDFPAPMLPQDEVHLVVKPGDDFNSVKRQLESLGSVVSERQKLLSGWAVPSSAISIAINRSPSTQRAVGRQVCVVDAKGIMSVLQSAISKMNNPNALTELQRFADAIGAKIDPKAEPKAIIIASLAGGSGAGMFIDVAEILKRSTSESWARESSAFLYTSEVFESLGAAGANVRKNSLGAINELVAGKCNGISNRTRLLYDKLDLPSDQNLGNNFGAKTNILIGSRNSSGLNLAQSSDGSGMDTVFMAIGEALADVYTNDRISEYLHKVAFFNADRVLIADHSGLGEIRSNSAPSNFTSFGFTKLAIGSHKFLDYVIDAITKFQIDNLLPKTLSDEENFQFERLLNSNYPELFQGKPYKQWPVWGSSDHFKFYEPQTNVKNLIYPEDYEFIFNDLMLQMKANKSFEIVATELFEIVKNEIDFSDYSSVLMKIRKINKSNFLNFYPSFKEILNISIHDFVNIINNPVEKTKREERFIAAHKAMLGDSQPLASLHKEALKHLKSFNLSQGPSGTMTNASKIPFSSESLIGQACIGNLAQFGVEINQDLFDEQWFHPQSSDSELFVISTPQAGLPFWAFESLTGPISTQVALAKDSPGMWVQFWEGQRTRPLVEAIPLHPEMRKSIITGWFVARLFNIAELQDLPVGWSARVWNPTLSNPGWSQFPRPVLVGPASDTRFGWILPSLLTSIGLAMVEFGQSGNPESIHPYQLLKFLGREVTTFVGKDQWDGNGMGDALPNGMCSRSSFIADWIKAGLVPNEEIVPNEIFGTEKMNADERKERIIAGLEELDCQYLAIWKDLADSHWAEMPHMWELKDEISEALADISAYVKTLSNPMVSPTV